jgi:hypothetical protein
MANRPLLQPSAFEPEEIAAMSEALEAALKEIGYAEQPEVIRETHPPGNYGCRKAG